MEMVEGTRRCQICDAPVAKGETCRNPVCSWDDRGFGCVWAIAYKTAALEKAIWELKYDNVRGWARIFGRVLVGYLDAHADRFEDVDLIVPSPGFGDRRHTGLVLQAAAIEAAKGGPVWPFDVESPPAIMKTKATESFASKRWRQRYEIATSELREALFVPDPARVRGKNVLVFDDVFTEGLTINEVGRALLSAGASTVDEVVLARQKFRG